MVLSKLAMKYVSMMPLKTMRNCRGCVLIRKTVGGGSRADGLPFVSWSDSSSSSSPSGIHSGDTTLRPPGMNTELEPLCARSESSSSPSTNCL